MFSSSILNRLEIAITKLSNDLRLKEQYNRIEAQQTRIEEQLAEVLELLEGFGTGMTPAEEAEVTSALTQAKDRLAGIGKGQS